MTPIFPHTPSAAHLAAVSYVEGLFPLMTKYQRVSLDVFLRSALRHLSQCHERERILTVRASLEEEARTLATKRARKREALTINVEDFFQ